MDRFLESPPTPAEIVQRPGRKQPSFSTRLAAAQDIARAEPLRTSRLENFRDFLRTLDRGFYLAMNGRVEEVRQGSDGRAEIVVREAPGRHAAMIERVYNAVDKISHLAAHFPRAIPQTPLTPPLWAEQVASWSHWGIHRLAPVSYQTTRVAQRLTVPEGRGIFHSLASDRPAVLGPLTDRLPAAAKMVWEPTKRLAAGWALAHAAEAFCLMAGLPVDQMVQTSLFAVGLAAPSLKFEFARLRGQELRVPFTPRFLPLGIPRHWNVDLGATVRTILRGTPQAVAFIGADTAINAASRAIFGVGTSESLGPLALPAKMMLFKYLVGSYATGLSLNLGTESLSHTLDRHWTATDELCQYFFLRDHDPTRARALLEAERRRPEHYPVSFLEPFFAQRGWAVLARIANGESLPPVEMRRGAEMLNTARNTLMMAIIDKPTRNRFRWIDPGRGQSREIIDHLEDSLPTIYGLSETIARQTIKSGWPDNTQADILAALGYRVQNDHDEILEMQREIGRHHDRTGRQVVVVSFLGSALTRSLAWLAETQPGVRGAAEFFIGHSQPALPRPELTTVDWAADLLSSPDIPRTIFLAHQFEELYGLSLALKGKGTPVVAQILAASTVSETDMTHYLTALDRNHLTPADLYTVFTALSRQNSPDPFVNQLMKSSLDNHGNVDPRALIEQLGRLPGNQLNQELSRIVQQHNLEGTLYDYASNGENLLGKLNIPRHSLKVQLEIIGHMELLSRPGNFIVENDVVIVRNVRGFAATSDFVAHIPKEYQAETTGTLQILQKALAAPDQDLHQANNDSRADFGLFLEYANRSRDKSPLFTALTHDLGAVPESDVQAAAGGDPVAFERLINRLATRPNSETLQALKPRDFHAWTQNFVFQDLFTKADNKQTVLNRLAFFASKAHLESAENLSRTVGTSALETPLTATDLLTGRATIDQIIGQYGPEGVSYTIDTNGVVRQTARAVQVTRDSYSPLIEQAFLAKEGKFYDNGREFITVLLGRKAASLLPGRTESGGSDPTMQFIQQLAREEPLGSGHNKFFRPALPLYQREKYNAAYLTELASAAVANQVPPSMQEVLGVNSGTPMPPDTLVMELVKMAREQGRIDDMCEKLETWFFVKRTGSLLTSDLNTTYMGQAGGLPVAGVQGAAMTMFGENADVNNLSIGKIALIDSLPQAPVIRLENGHFMYWGEELTPDQFWLRFRAQGQATLSLFRSKGIIDDGQFQQARDEIEQTPLDWKLPKTFVTTDPTGTVAGIHAPGGFRLVDLQSHELPGAELSPIAPIITKQVITDQDLETRWKQLWASAKPLPTGRGWQIPLDGKAGTTESATFIPAFTQILPDGSPIEKPGIALSIMGPGGEMWANINPTNQLGLMMRPGSTEKLVEAVWRQYVAGDVTTKKFGTVQTVGLGGEVFRNPILNPYSQPGVGTNANAGVTLVQNNALSLNGPMIEAARDLQQRDPDNWQKFQQFRAQFDYEARVWDDTQKSFVVATEPPPLAAIGNDIYVPLEAQMRAVAAFLQPRKYFTDPRLIAAVETVMKAQMDDQLKKTSVNGFQLNAYSQNSLSSTLDGVPRVLLFKSGSPAFPVPGPNGEPLTESGISIAGVDLGNGEFAVIAAVVQEQHIVKGGVATASLESALGSSNGSGGVAVGGLVRRIASWVRQTALTQNRNAK